MYTGMYAEISLRGGGGELERRGDKRGHEAHEGDGVGGGCAPSCAERKSYTPYTI